jgi:hypothetical protein
VDNGRLAEGDGSGLTPWWSLRQGYGGVTGWLDLMGASMFRDGGLLQIV